MKGLFWIGAGSGALAAGLAALLLARAGEPDHEPAGAATGRRAAASLEERLAAAERELAQVRADAAREVSDARALAAALEARLDAMARQPVPAAASRRDQPGLAGKVPGLAEWLRHGDFTAAASALSAALAAGTLTKLELMQLGVQSPGLVVAGINQFALPDAFRAILIDTLASLEDPLQAMAQLRLDEEPNQRFAARMAGVVAQLVERSAEPDTRAVPVIQKLLAGNPMQGEKVNLYPVLAQLAALGDQDALAMVRAADVGVFAPGLATLLDPPAQDELGRRLTGAVIYSIQYNKGQWGDRPIQLRGGDTVVSLGGERVASATDFASALKRHRGLGPTDFVDAGVLRRDAQGSGRYEFVAVRLDPGDLQLMYGVYSARRRPGG